ncbi:transposase [Streptosporangium sp. NBC_01756]|uniref:transposase n=1 Tax=Streptosporangium sp. NBC_01756 TaxID=2975950 RepID=UPI002DD94811|nr:transposase [Streptosporangium sp. NBC_01756]WSC87873.1 transposase [Streptosporangium sp. NBC_01756]
MQRLQFFLSESPWDHEKVNAQRLELLRADPATAPHAGGVLAIDDTGDRKDGTATAHTAHQYPGSVGKIENGIVAVTTLWADEQVYYPLHALPYTPAARLPRGRSDPAFRTKPQLAAVLTGRAQAVSLPGEVRTRRAPGPRSCGGFAMAAPACGGPRTRSWAATARTRRSG